MLSRVANLIYWMSRYLERADNVARFIDVNVRLILDMGWENETKQWEPLVRTTGDEAEFEKRYKQYNENSVIDFLAFDENNPNSILSCVENARENARTVREIISSEMWETINELYHYVQNTSQKRKYDIQKFCTHLHNSNHLFAGLIYNTMSHTEAWHFARVGRMLERADKTARMLDVKYFLLLPNDEHVDSPHDALEWGTVLKSVSGFEMYRKQFHRARFKDVTQFLVLDPQFPRAIRYCIHNASHSLSCITEMLGIEVEVTEQMNTLKESLDNTNIDTILDNGLHEFIDVIQYNLNVVDNSLYKSFFTLDKTMSSSQSQ